MLNYSFKATMSEFGNKNILRLTVMLAYAPWMVETAENALIT